MFMDYKTILALLVAEYHESADMIIRVEIMSIILGTNDKND